MVEIFRSLYKYFFHERSNDDFFKNWIILITSDKVLVTVASAIRMWNYYHSDCCLNSICLLIMIMFCFHQLSLTYLNCHFQVSQFFGIQKNFPQKICFTSWLLYLLRRFIWFPVQDCCLHIILKVTFHSYKNLFKNKLGHLALLVFLRI